MVSHPEWFLVSVAVTVVFFLLRKKRFYGFSYVPAHGRTFLPQVPYFLMALGTLSLGAFLAGITLPRTATDDVRIIVWDMSRSMLEGDLMPSREEKALSLLKAVLCHAPKGASYGLVVVGERAYVAVPPTPDVAGILSFLPHLRRLRVSSDGSAVSEGIFQALALGARRVIILSDGLDNAGPYTFEAALAQAREKGVILEGAILLPPQARAQAKGLENAIRQSGGTVYALEVAPCEALPPKGQRIELSSGFLILSVVCWLGVGLWTALGYYNILEE
ncbi:MAG: vWA domain-containing protein [Bacteroidia bacterium]